MSDPKSKNKNKGSDRYAFNNREALARLLDQRGIFGKERAQFLAQVDVESGGFGKLYGSLEEQGSDSRLSRLYDNKRTLGNNSPGDGKRFKGRGFIQLTGRHNYRHFGNLIGEDLLANPERAADPEVAARLALAYWDERVKPKVKDFQDTEAVTRAIRGDRKGKPLPPQAHYSRRNNLYTQYLRSSPEHAVEVTPNNMQVAPPTEDGKLSDIERRPMGINYKYGGGISTSLKPLYGGNLQSLGHGAFVIKGRDHSKGGVKMKTGGRVIEAENDEIYLENNKYIVRKDLSKPALKALERLGTKSDAISKSTSKHIQAQLKKQNDQQLLSKGPKFEQGGPSTIGFDITGGIAGAMSAIPGVGGVIGSTIGAVNQAGKAIVDAIDAANNYTPEAVEPISKESMYKKGGSLNYAGGGFLAPNYQTSLVGANSYFGNTNVHSPGISPYENTYNLLPRANPMTFDTSLIKTQGMPAYQRNPNPPTVTPATPVNFADGKTSNTELNNTFVTANPTNSNIGNNPGVTVAQRQGLFSDLSQGDKLQLASAAPAALYNTIMGLMPAERETPRFNQRADASIAEMRRLQIDPQQFINNANLQANAVRSAVNNTAQSPGVRNALNMAVLSNTQRQVGDFVAQAQAQNNAYTAQAAQLNMAEGAARAQERARVDELNDLNKAAQQRFGAQVANQLTKTLQDLGVNKNAALTNQITLDTLNSLATKFKLNVDDLQDFLENKGYSVVMREDK